MRPSPRRRARRRRAIPSTFSLLAISIAATTAGAISFNPAPAANLDFSQLGRIGVAGDFSGISLFEFQEQTQRPFATDGTESLLARVPNGVFASVVQTDASILAMCDLTGGGASAGVVLGGNFTSFGGKESQGIALFNPDNSAVTPIAGLSGQVNALLCDRDKNTVYLGGSFVGANSTNALAWTGASGFQDLPFAGFNGPVSSITKASNGHIIFGGSFTGLGNASIPSSKPDNQVINLSTANISSGSTLGVPGFDDPKNIICKNGVAADEPGNIWLLQDNTPGFWQANFRFGFQPSKLRLYNTHRDGRGTKTWRFTALPINGILNFTYIDPATGANRSCTSECPLSNDPAVKFQDFHFVNIIGINAFRIDVSAWYGLGGGLSGIELYGNDIFVFAIDDFNEPTCAGLPFGSSATKTGPWTVTPSHASSSEYLTAVIPSPITASSASIVFSPDIKESGSYSVHLYTPGCLQDDTCATRGQFTVNGSMTADGKNKFSVPLYQTNNYDKYDQIYFGDVDASSTGFRPQVTMTPLAGQNLPNMTFVAQKVGFSLINPKGGLVGLFEYDPSSTGVNASDFSQSAFDQLGASFDAGSAVYALATAKDVTFIAGNFTSRNASHIVALSGSTMQALDGGLNGQVLSMALDGTSLYVGGNFTGNRDNSSTALNHVAVYDSIKNSWSPLGAGVNGKVLKVIPLTMNVSSTEQLVISVNGDFTRLEAFGGFAAAPANGFGIWVPSSGNWLQNLQVTTEGIDGILSSSLLKVGNNTSLYGGSLSSSTLGGANGVANLGSSVGKFPANITAAPTNATVSGVVAATFDKSGGRNNTILAGHFPAIATDGSAINNLLIIDASGSTTGLSSAVMPNSTFMSVLAIGDTLFAGGSVTATINGAVANGLVTYDLATKSIGAQPPSLAGGSTTVSAIALRPNTGDVYVGGDFSSAGSLGCPGACFYSTTSSQWNRPGTNLGGSIESMLWTSPNTLVAGGNLKVNSSDTTYLVTYDASKQMWDSFPGADKLPGPVQVVTAASSDSNQLWVAGTTVKGAAYIMKYDGANWASPNTSLQQDSRIRGLQVFSLTAPHDATPLVDANQVLMVTGSLQLPSGASASAATFNGASFTPYLLTTSADNTGRSSVSHIFVENSNFFTGGPKHMPLVFVVLIGLAISLALMLLLVVAGLVLDRLRKAKEGYMPAPTSMYDRSNGLERIPPGELLGELHQGRPGAPHV